MNNTNNIKFKDCEGTWICQLNKPEARATLEKYSKIEHATKTDLKNYYKFIVTTLHGTLAWNVSGVNKMINTLTTSVKHAAKVKTNFRDVAKDATYKLNLINKLIDEEVPNDKSNYFHKVALEPTLTDAELEMLDKEI